jgi:hypothetical protein
MSVRKITLALAAIAAVAVPTLTSNTASAFGRSFASARFVAAPHISQGYARGYGRGWSYGRGWCYWHPYSCYYR